MINRLLRIVAPYYCYTCHQIGTLLCENCKYDITDEGNEVCIVCAVPSSVGICASCRTTYQKAWCVGDRSGALEAVINGLKFERVKDAAITLGGLLDERLPLFPQDTQIVTIPTLPRHIRQRGYDHVLLIARELATRRGLTVMTPLIRQTQTQQRGQAKKERFKQAKRAFTCNRSLDPDVPYLLVDDIVTTNATLRYAAQALQDAGAKIIWVAVVARQPLEKEKIA